DRAVLRRALLRAGVLLPRTARHAVPTAPAAAVLVPACDRRAAAHGEGAPVMSPAARHRGSRTAPAASHRPGGPMVKAEGVHKSFGRLEVLKGISFEVAPREVMCLL